MFTFYTPKRKFNIFCGPDDPPAPNPNPNPPAPNPNPNPNPPAPNPSPKMMTQEEVNALLAREKRTYQERTAGITKQLEELRDSASTSEEQKQALQTQIDEMQAQFQTKEQQATAAYTKLKTKYDTDLKTEIENTNRWRSRFEKQLMHTEISRFAANANAYDVDQIAAILIPNTKVVERADEAGKPTGEFISQVDFMAKGENGKLVPMKLSIEDAIKAMKEWPEKYGNLFRTKANGGLGGDNVPPDPNKKAPELKPDMSMEDYVKMRKEMGITGE